MKIALLVINHNKREGTSKAIAEVAERLGKNHEVHVFSRSAEGVDLKDVKLHLIRGPKYPHLVEFLGYVIPCADILKHHRFDIVHAAGAISTHADFYTIQNIQPAKRAVLAALEKKEKVSLMRRFTRRAYLSVTGNWERKAYEGRSPRRPYFLPVSSGVGRELKAHYRIGDAKIKIVPNGADTALFRPIDESERRTVREQFNLRMSDFVSVFSGGEWRRKGLDLAIQAMAQIQNDDVKLLVLGEDDGDQAFEKMAVDLGVQTRVIFAGFQRNVEKPLACADVFLFPSRYEAFSLASLEAAACGLPVIAPRINGAEDFIIPGENGEFIDHDSAQIASIIRALIPARSRCREMGQIGRRLVETDYTWDRIAALTEAAYEERIDFCAANA